MRFVACIGIAALCAIPAMVSAEQFDTDVSQRWTTYLSDNAWNQDAVVHPTVSGGALVSTIPTWVETGQPGNVSGTLLDRNCAIAVDSTAGSFFNPDAPDNNTFYAGSANKLFGDLTGRALVATYKIQIDQLASGTALTNAHFYAGSYGHPAGTSYELTDHPEEVRTSLYIRSNTVASGDSAANESTRWFNENQANRMVFAAPGSAGLQNDVYYTMVSPLTQTSLWNNYWGFGNANSTDAALWSASRAAQGYTTAPGATANSAFKDTIANSNQIRLQIDSSYYGTGGTALAPGLTGRLVVDRIFAAAPGDANVDTAVDGSDYNIVLATLGTTQFWQQGNFNEDAVVDGSDYNIVLANLGTTAADSTSAPRAQDANGVHIKYDPATGALTITVPDMGSASGLNSILVTGPAALSKPFTTNGIDAASIDPVAWAAAGGGQWWQGYFNGKEQWIRNSTPRLNNVTDLLLATYAPGLTAAQLSTVEYGAKIGATTSTYFSQVEIVAVPEPASLGFLALGGLLALRRRAA